MAAVNCVALTNVVVRLPPFHCTIALFSKLLPFTVNVNAAPPAIAEFGTSVDSTATGVVTLKKNVFDVPPPGAGFTTMTGTLGFARLNIRSGNRRRQRRRAHKRRRLRRAIPIHHRIANEICSGHRQCKREQTPALTLFGESAVIVGTGFVVPEIVNVTEFDVPPPGVGFVTVTAALPAVSTSID